MTAMLDALTAELDEEIEDADEETFLLYAQPGTSQNLGFIDPKASGVEVTVAGRYYTIHQSPGVLNSSRAGGTTGAVLWKITPLFAEWLSSPTNMLFTSNYLSAESIILELGCGISPLNALALAPRVSRYILTDQSYVQRLIQLNISENNVSKTPKANSKKGRGKSRGASGSGIGSGGNIHFTTLDWECDQVTPSLTSSPQPSFDAVIACDCVYNYALVQPFVQTCVDACKLRRHSTSQDSVAAKPCLCIVAQQLRNDDVFNSWLAAFFASFHVWRVPEGALPEELRPRAGFVVHVGVLRDEA